VIAAALILSSVRRRGLLLKAMSTETVMLTSETWHYFAATGLQGSKEQLRITMF
jgi:hypothetical protein